MATTRSKRLRLATQKTSPDDAQTGPPCTMDKKKERKRVTDREAQREHRKRRKQYVEELEAKIELLKQNSSSPEVTALLMENEKLREELKSLRSFFNTVQDLVKLQQPSNCDQLASPRPVSTPEHSLRNGLASTILVQETAPKASQTTTPASDVELQVEATDSNLQAFTSRDDVHDTLPDWPLTHSAQMTFAESRQIDAPGTRDGTTEELQDDVVTIIDATSVELEHPVDVALGSWLDQPEHRLIMSDMTTTEFPTAMDCDTAGPWDIDHFCDSVFLDQDNATLRRPWLGHWPAYPSTEFLEHHSGLSMFPTQSAALSMLVPQPCLTSHLEISSAGFQSNPGAEQSFDATPSLYYQKHLPEKPSWLGLPMLLFPGLPSDARLHNFVREYTEPQPRPRPKLRRPMILDFLMNNPTDHLSQAVKQYLSPLRGSMGLSELLASYWIISLILRWHVNQDEESFADLPRWLRPTMLQTGISQPLSVSFMPWPLVRDQLMLETFTNWNGAVEVMIALGKHLKVDLAFRQNCGQTAPAQRSHVNHSIPEAPASHADLLEEELGDLRNWSLHDHFFLQFPEFRDSYQRSRETLITDPRTN